MSTPSRNVLAYRTASTVVTISAATILAIHEALWGYQAFICEAIGQYFKQSPSGIAIGFAISVAPWLIVVSSQFLHWREKASALDIWRGLSACVAVLCVVQRGMFRVPLHDHFFCNGISFAPGLVTLLLGTVLAALSLVVVLSVLACDWLRLRRNRGRTHHA
jgi:hypothetical protein